MPIHRRELLLAAIVVPAAAAAGAVAARFADGVRAAAPRLRPQADGTSATRCAACGGRNHAMLNPRCPAARRVL